MISDGSSSAPTFDDYTLLTTTNLSTLTTSNKVVIAYIDGSKGVTGYSGSDATLSETLDDWLQFEVTNVTSTTYSLKDSNTGKWITLNASNKFTISSSSETELIADENGYLAYVDSKSATRYLCTNSTFHRCYTAIGTYTPFYAFIVAE